MKLIKTPEGHIWGKDHFFKLGGRMGRVVNPHAIGGGCIIRWEGETGDQHLDLRAFPDVMLGVEDPKITFAAAQHILQQFDEIRCVSMGRQTLEHILNGMVS